MLHTIGPGAASCIRDLTLRGVVSRHPNVAPQARVKGKMRGGDLVQLLRLYTPFLVQLCTGLKKLTLEIEHDPMLDHEYMNAILRVNLDPQDAVSLEDRLLPVLENELRALDSLVELNIVDVDGMKFVPEFA